LNEDSRDGLVKKRGRHVKITQRKIDRKNLLVVHMKKETRQETFLYTCYINIHTLHSKTRIGELGGRTRH
jgi:hypothetical protein